MKKCTKCGIEKPLTYFGKHKLGKDGINPWCKQCVRENGRAWYIKNIEKVSENYRNWRTANKEKVYENNRQWRQANPDKASASNKKWVKNNPDKVKNIRQTRRLRKRMNGGKMTLAEWGLMKEFYNYVCLCCGQREPNIVLVPDHVIPVSKGGTNSAENIQPLCSKCNARKGTKTTDYRKS